MGLLRKIWFGIMNVTLLVMFAFTLYEDGGYMASLIDGGGAKKLARKYITLTEAETTVTSEANAETLSGAAELLPPKKGAEIYRQLSALYPDNSEFRNGLVVKSLGSVYTEPFSPTEEGVTMPDPAAAADAAAKLAEDIDLAINTGGNSFFLYMKASLAAKQYVFELSSGKQPDKALSDEMLKWVKIGSAMKNFDPGLEERRSNLFELLKRKGAPAFIAASFSVTDTHAAEALRTLGNALFFAGKGMEKSGDLEAARSCFTSLADISADIKANTNDYSYFAAALKTDMLASSGLSSVSRASGDGASADRFDGRAQDIDKAFKKEEGRIREALKPYKRGMLDANLSPALAATSGGSIRVDNAIYEAIFGSALVIALVIALFFLNLYSIVMKRLLVKRYPDDKPTHIIWEMKDLLLINIPLFAVFAGFVIINRTLPGRMLSIDGWLVAIQSVHFAAVTVILILGIIFLITKAVLKGTSNLKEARNPVWFFLGAVAILCAASAALLMGPSAEGARQVSMSTTVFAAYAGTMICAIVLLGVGFSYSAKTADAEGLKFMRLRSWLAVRYAGLLLIITLLVALTLQLIVVGLNLNSEKERFANRVKAAESSLTGTEFERFLETAVK